MKLSSDFITHEMDGKQYMVSVGASEFSGLVKNNKTAAFIVDCLKNETTRDAILDKMEEKYDAPRELMGADLDKVIEKLRGIGAVTDQDA